MTVLSLLIQKGKVLNISKSDLGKALTAKVAINGKLVDNPYKKWSDVNPSLPNVEIRIYGPPTTSGTRASFAEMVNEKGYCKKDADAKAALKAAGMKAKKCRAMRTDGAFMRLANKITLLFANLIITPSVVHLLTAFIPAAKQQHQHLFTITFY